MRSRCAGQSFIPLACALIVSLGAGPAQAYVRTRTSGGAQMFWNRTVMEINAYVGDPPPVLTAADIMIAVRGAAETWSRDKVDCTSMDLRVRATLDRSAPVELDGVSRLTFRRENWCKEPRTADETCYDPLALAVTSVFARKSDGEIVDADVELNAVTFTWSDLVRRPETADGSMQDLQNTLTHEFGHFIGLDHTCFISLPRAGTVDDQGRPVPSCSSAPEDIRATTMFAAVIPGDLDRRSLTADDRRAVCDVYPNLDLTLESGGPAGCSLARRPVSAGAGLAALGLGALLIAARRRRTARPARASRSSTDRPPCR